MWIIWDILTVAIVLTFAAASYRKGFLHTVTRLVGVDRARCFFRWFTANRSRG